MTVNGHIFLGIRRIKHENLKLVDLTGKDQGKDIEMVWSYGVMENTHLTRDWW